jgi:hypothetical protein
MEDRRAAPAIPARKNRFRVGLCAAREIVAGM